MANLAESKRVVIKMGTQIVIDENGKLAEARLKNIVAQVASIREGREILLVSSGAVGLGRGELNLWDALDLPEKQACAAVGQSLLIESFRTMFGKHGIRVAQLLLTDLDFADRNHYLNLTQTFEALLRLGVIPIINENDPVSSRELREKSKAKSFGDNDKLSALVASKLGADALVILTNVDGIYTDNPQSNPNARRIEKVEKIEELSSIQTSGQSLHGRGGMSSKIEAARIASYGGVSTVITSGLRADSLLPFFEKPNAGGEENGLGTWIAPRPRISKRERWIGFSAGYSGVLVVNEGARQALLKNSSLLSAGIVSATGDFAKGEVISIQSERGEELGRGVARHGIAVVDAVKGLNSQKLKNAGRSEEEAVVVHKDDLVLLVEEEVQDD